MKKLFQILSILFVLVLATSAWSAGIIKTFQLKLYHPSIAYDGVDHVPTATNSGVTTGFNTNFNAGAAISSVSEFTHCGGPGNQNVIVNTTDSRTIDLNNYIGDMQSGFDIVFSPNTVTSESGVTVGRNRYLTGNNSDAGVSWMLGVKFSPVDDATMWENVPVFWAGPLDQTLISTNSINFDDRGGVTGVVMNSGTSVYPWNVQGLNEWAYGDGVSPYLIQPPVMVQRYVRPVIAGTSNLVNPEYWMSLIPK